MLSKLVAEVFSIEIVEPLAAPGDGYQGWPEYAPFDAIIVICAPDRVPEPLLEQLKEGGRMIIPSANAAFRSFICWKTRRQH